MSLLTFIQKIALLTDKLKWVVWAMAVSALAVFSWLILAAEPGLDPFILPTAVAFGWAICLLGIASNFQQIPQKPDSEAGFFRRVRMRISYGIAWFWAAVFVLCSLILFYMSIRSVFIALAV